MAGIPPAPAPVPAPRCALPTGRPPYPYAALPREEPERPYGPESEQLALDVTEIGAAWTPWRATGVFPPPNPTIAPRIPYSPSPPQRVVAQSALVRRQRATVVRRGRKRNAAHLAGARGLSDREGDVMDLVTSGMTNSPIAAVCSGGSFADGKSVKNHCDRNFTTLHASSRSEAVALWLGTAHATEGGPRHHA